MMKKIIFTALMFLIIFGVYGCVTTTDTTATAMNTDPGSTSGVTYEKIALKNEYMVTGYEGSDTTVVISSTYDGIPVTTIRNINNSAITSIVLPDSITYVEIGSLYNTGISELTIPKKLYYFAQAFSSPYASDFIDIDFIIPADHTYFKEAVICGRDAVVTKDETVLIALENTADADETFILPSTYVEIASYACSRLSFGDITLPISVTKIGTSAFSKSVFENLTVYGHLSDIGEGCFWSVVFDRIEFENSIDVIEYNAFCKASGQEVILPASVQEIGPYAFYDSSIETIVLPEYVKYIRDRAFAYAGFAGELVLPEGLETIEQYAFSSNWLNSVVLPSTLSELDVKAFYNYSTSAVSKDLLLTRVQFESLSFVESESDLMTFVYGFVNYSFFMHLMYEGNDFTITIVMPTNTEEAERLEAAFQAVIDTYSSEWELYDNFVFETP